MGAPNYHNFAAISGSSVYDREKRDRGKYYDAEIVSGSAGATPGLSTGSFGAAFMLGAGADDAKTQIHMAAGGIITGPDLTEKVLYEIGVSEVRCEAGKVFIFKRQQ